MKTRAELVRELRELSVRFPAMKDVIDDALGATRPRDVVRDVANAVERALKLALEHINQCPPRDPTLKTLVCRVREARNTGTLPDTDVDDVASVAVRIADLRNRAGHDRQGALTADHDFESLNGLVTITRWSAGVCGFLDDSLAKDARPRPRTSVSNSGNMSGIILMLHPGTNPPPAAEIQAHLARCAAHGTTAIATTKPCAGLMAGHAVVFWTKPRSGSDELLAVGDVEGFLRPGDAEHGAAANEVPYSTHGLPKSMDQVYFIKVRNLVPYSPGTRMAALRSCYIVGGRGSARNGKPLPFENLGDGQSKAYAGFVGDPRSQTLSPASP